MTRRFVVSTVLAVPLLVIAMSDMLPSRPLHGIVPGAALMWLQFALATPVVLWGGLPFFQRGWASLVTRNLNMFTLIAIGTGVAYVFSTVAVVAPGRFPSAFRGPGGEVGDWLAALGLPVFGWVGLTLIAVAVLLIGAQAALGYSWVAVAEATGKGVHNVARMAVEAVDVAARMARSLWSSLWRSAAAGEPETRRVAAAPKKQSPRVTASRPRTRKAAAKTGAMQPPTVDTPRAAAESGKPVGQMPDLDLLDREEAPGRGGFSDQNIEDMSRLLESKLGDFGIEATVDSVLPGPVVTRFEVQPAAGVKVSRITALAKDLARSLAVISVRIVEVIPGKTVVGIEIPNQHRETVRLREVLASDVYQRADSPLTMALGKDISGDSVVADIARMPHLLIAGTTGSGKSVGVNAMLLSMLYKATPEELRLILVDPKMLELSVYEGIPHLLTPVVTDMKDAATALNWCV